MKAIAFGMALLLAIPAAAALAQAPEGSQAAFLRAREDFGAARKGDTSATGRAVEQFTRLVAEQPLHPLYRAYLGGSYCLKARDGWFPFSKLANAEAGLTHLDEALRLITAEHDQQRIDGAPVSLETRLVAVSTMLGVPGFMNRLQQAREVLAEAMESPAFPASPSGLQAAFFVRAADVAKRDDIRERERQFLRRALDAAPDSPAGQEARERLQRLGA